ncbi:CPBP family intramembrane glutamic endopeptidase [Hymenobacter endophyticus]|uniref:CPBP family intramembrane glutamic endopeptidase n=1 Tax=Hymenobacter endophyticus TaxID=3076335 RepID=A0ABU3TEX4_9BACT|nr:CPBP family intramembrane glutamic endopeptidase [Hymenobacter endophyticus]MDU0369909.1 CPBP family intramembrane glutamic endopeptidase [Hymenobacter endophyticus]
MKGFVSSRLHPFANLGLLMVLLLAAFCVASLLVMVLNYLFFGVGMQDMGNVTQRPADYPNGWGVSMLSQGVLLLGGLGGAALALAALTGNKLADYFMPSRPVPAGWPLLAGLIIVASLPAMSVLIAWNAGWDLPAWAVAKEEQANAILKILTNFSSPLRFGVAVLVMAIIPAVSEELFFRGVLQRNLVQWAGRHTGVWLTAIVFSAIHMQFEGFVPRFVLGLVLGYLYEWSRNILVPIAAHFAQNAFQLVLLYARQREWSSSDFDPDSTEALPWYWVLASLGLCAAGLWYLYQQTQAPRPDALPTEMHTLGARGVAVSRPAAPTSAASRTLSHDGVDATKAN